MTTRLDEDDRDVIRGLWAEGASALELSERYEVTERHVRRLVAGVEQRPSLHVGPEGVEAAVRDFLARLPDKDSADDVLAQTALVLARKLDKADSRTAAGLARQLVDLVEALRGEDREPDALDELQRRYRARTLATRTAW